MDLTPSQRFLWEVNERFHCDLLLNLRTQKHLIYGYRMYQEDFFHADVLQKFFELCADWRCENLGSSKRFRQVVRGLYGELLVVLVLCPDYLESWIPTIADHDLERGRNAGRDIKKEWYKGNLDIEVKTKTCYLHRSNHSIKISKKICESRLMWVSGRYKYYEIEGYADPDILKEAYENKESLTIDDLTPML